MTRFKKLFRGQETTYFKKDVRGQETTYFKKDVRGQQPAIKKLIFIYKNHY
jgi:hypothetical protein